MKSVFLMSVMALIMLVGCVSPQVVTCPTAPHDVIAHCQSISGQTSYSSSGNSVYYKGFAFNTGGGGTTRGVNQFEYMRCMKQFGYRCNVEDMYPSSTSAIETAPNENYTREPSTGLVTGPLRNNRGVTVKPLDQQDKEK